MKRLIVFIVVIGSFIAGVYVGSLDLSFAASSSELTELQPSSTEPPPELTEQQVIDIFLIELKDWSKNSWNRGDIYGCLLECEGRQFPNREIVPRVDDDEQNRWSAAYNVGVQKINERIRYLDTDGVYRTMWKAEYVKNGWWLIRAKELGYWLLNEDKEWVMACEVFSTPELMNVLSKYIAINAPAAEGICSAAVES